MKTQIVYVVISSEDDLFLEELWVSLFSLRIYHPEAKVKVLVDAPTAERIHQRPTLDKMITEVVTVEVPEEYSPMARSRVIKTTVRNVIDGPFLFMDTDTVVCHSLDEVDDLDCDIAAVPDAHQSLKEDLFGNSKIQLLKSTFGLDITDAEFYFNSGVMYVADNELTRRFYKRWYENWQEYLIDGKRRADQPPLIKTDKEFGYIIRRLPDVFNCQLALSVKYFHEAYIVHFFHMDFIKDQSYSPFMGLSVYREIKEAGGITPHAEELIVNCKSSFETTSMIVGSKQMEFYFSPFGQAFSSLYDESTSWQKRLNWIAIKIIKFRRGKQKIIKLFKSRK